MPALLLLLLGLGAATPADARPRLRAELGVTRTGEASARWLAMIRRRVPSERYDSIAAIRRPLQPSELAWAELIRSRIGRWEDEIPALARLFEPVAAPDRALIVLGNRGGEDAFTHDSVTIGFDLAALQRVYGDAAAAENPARIDRLFRHEYVHLLQKAWLGARPYPMDTPLAAAVAEIWAEGLGTYYSMSDRWRLREGRPSPAAAEALERLEPRFAERLAALACAEPEAARALTADLSYGAFDRKWGALPGALWLEAEASRSGAALRSFVLEGPDAVWALAARHLPGRLGDIVAAARAAGARCEGPR